MRDKKSAFSSGQLIFYFKIRAQCLLEMLESTAVRQAGH